MSEPVILCDAWVPGHAKTKGSLEHVGKGVLQDSPGSKAWRKLIAERVRVSAAKRGNSTDFHSYAGRVAVRIISYAQMSDTKSKGVKSWLERAKEWLIARAGFGDVDKLARNVLDAISSEALDDAHLIVDDSQVVDLYSHKRLCLPGMMPGQQIQVWTIPEEVPW